MHMRYIRLTKKKELENLYKSNKNFVVRARCMCLLLSEKGNSIAKV